MLFRSSTATVNVIDYVSVKSDQLTYFTDLLFSEKNDDSKFGYRSQFNFQPSNFSFISGSVLYFDKDFQLNDFGYLRRADWIHVGLLGVFAPGEEEAGEGLGLQGFPAPEEEEEQKLLPGGKGEGAFLGAGLEGLEASHPKPPHTREEGFQKALLPRLKGEEGKGEGPLPEPESWKPAFRTSRAREIGRAHV